MLKIIAVILTTIPFFTTALVAQAAAKGPLYGLVLVLDPGHGGKDPGSNGVFQGKSVFENEYTYDTVKRIELFAKERGAVVFKTLVDRKVDCHRNLTAQQVFPDNKEEYFAWDNSQARARTIGLSKRVAFANRILAKYPRHKVVFVSIHFDIAPAGHEGSYCIVPNHGHRPRIADFFTKAFRELSANRPVKVAGEDVKNIYILGDRNHVREKVLIELGNFNSSNDNWEIRNYQTRNRYALRIVGALENYIRAK